MIKLLKNSLKYSKLKEIPWEQIAFPHYLKKQNAIPINLGNVSPWLNPGIVCIHDVNCIKNPKNFQRRMVIWYKFLFKRAINKGIKIITVSEFSKKEMLQCYNVDSNKIQVINLIVRFGVGLVTTSYAEKLCFPFLV